MHVLSPALVAMAALSGASGCDLFNECEREGPQTSSVSLAISSDLVARDRATTVEVCVVGGRCETRPLPSLSAFADLLPARVTRQGSAGPPVRITATLYDGRTSVLASQATLGPVTMNPGISRTCHYPGYWVAAKLGSDGVLGYQQFA